MHAHRMRTPSVRGVVVGAVALLAAALLLVPALADARNGHKHGKKRGTFVSGLITGLPGGGMNCEAPCSPIQNGDASMTWNTANVQLSGPLEGPAVEVFTAATFTDGHTELWGTGVFTGTYKGRSGTATYRFSGTGTTAIKGPITFVSGTGGLAKLRGTVRWAPADEPNTFTYKGRLRFAR